jgi:hypothetical protein
MNGSDFSLEWSKEVFAPYEKNKLITFLSY